MDRDAILHAIEHPPADPPRPGDPAFTATVLARARLRPPPAPVPTASSTGLWWFAGVLALALCVAWPGEELPVAAPDGALLVDLAILAGVALAAGLAIAIAATRSAVRVRP